MKEKMLITMLKKTLQKMTKKMTMTKAASSVVVAVFGLFCCVFSKSLLYCLLR